MAATFGFSGGNSTHVRDSPFLHKKETQCSQHGTRGRGKIVDISVQSSTCCVSIILPTRRYQPAPPLANVNPNKEETRSSSRASIFLVLDHNFFVVYDFTRGFQSMWAVTSNTTNLIIVGKHTSGSQLFPPSSVRTRSNKRRKKH